MSARFKAGDRVRVRVGAPPGHFRTPTYIQGKVGAVERLHGGDGLPKRPLYLVRFAQPHVWPKYPGPPRDQLLMDIFEHWLEPA